MDIVEIRDGPVWDTAYPVAVYSGLLSGVTNYVSATNVLLIKFTSDDSITKSGFRMSYLTESTTFVIFRR